MANTISETFYWFMLARYVESLPWWRRWAAHFFESRRVTEEEFEEWLYSDAWHGKQYVK